MLTCVGAHLLQKNSLYLQHEDINQFISSPDLALTAASSKQGLTLTGLVVFPRDVS